MQTQTSIPEYHDDTRRHKLVERIDGLLEWMQYQEVDLTFWDTLIYLLHDVRSELK